MSVSQIQSVPSTDEYDKLTQQELKTRLDAADKILQDTLALCARNIDIALAEGSRIWFVGDITDALHACEASWRLVDYLERFDPNYRLVFTGHALNWVRNELGASKLATCCFYLYYDGVVEVANHRTPNLVPEANVPNVLLFLENVFQRLLSSQNIKIVLCQKFSGSICSILGLSEGSYLNLPLQQFLLDESLRLQQESRGVDISFGELFDPANAKVRLQASSGDYLQQGAGMVQNNLGSSLKPQQAPTLTANYDRFLKLHAQDQVRKVAVRKDPQIQLGPVDSSCAFVVCNPVGQDCPIFYASEAFELLTGYKMSEIRGRNCRFLQAPDGHLESGVRKQSAKSQSLRGLRYQIALGREYQLTLINYKKGGQPFANLLTIVPVLDGLLFFYVGFLIDIAEHPGCILGKNANGTYRVNYSATQVPGPVDAPTAPADIPAPVLQSNEPADPMELMSRTTPEADSPWTVTDGPAPPYVLSPGVFYHTSRMGMLSP